MSETTVAPVIRALIRGMVDYAGLFPPANLTMAEAVANYAAYAESPDAWALGRFVVTSARLSEFEDQALLHMPNVRLSDPWRLSLLVHAPGDATAIPPFNDRWRRRVVADAVEAKAASPEDVGALARAVPDGVTLFLELAVDDALERCLQAIRENAVAAKVRTGGVTAAAFPAPASVVRFIRACHSRGVSFKATAGLHHPVRGSYRLDYGPNSDSGLMYGYLNVLFAAAVVQGGGSDEEAMRVLLADDVSSLRVADGAVRWEEMELPLDQLLAARTFVHGFGSCSFREPIDGLSALPLATA
ncbi:MAG: hypothetical protein ACT4P7_14165 [Gemmatimonadaceae bacterium]